MLSLLVVFSAVVTGESYSCVACTELLPGSHRFHLTLFLSVSFVVGWLLLFCFVLAFVSCMKAYNLRLSP